jgi:hypothetical protein
MLLELRDQNAASSDKDKHANKCDQLQNTITSLPFGKWTNGRTQDKYLSRCILARSLFHCCSRKAIRIKYYECVSLALTVGHENGIISAQQIADSGLPGSTTFSAIIS